MKQICPPEKCTGCWACYNICPKQCIQMKEGKLLHLYPTINQEKCINCGLCQKVCPSNHPLPRKQPLHTYAAWAKDEQEYKTSTSGGTGACLSRYIIQNNGIVYGCACLPNAEIKHIRVENEKDLSLLKGSKYVQSSIDNSYLSVKKDLINEKTVLFIGTPCQVAGLKSYLKKNYTNLYTIDIICHGVPSLQYLKQHLYKKTKTTQYDYVKFRENSGDYILKVSSNGNILYYYNLWKSRYKDEYCNAFIDGYTFRDSCHSCPYAAPTRVSDITIGDFWGFKDDINHPHPHGLSCILCNTEKGNYLIDKIKDTLYIYERELEEAVNGNSQLQAPVPQNFRILLYTHLAGIFNLSTAYNICIFDHKHNLYKIRGLGFILRRIDKLLNKIFCK